MESNRSQRIPVSCSICSKTFSTKQNLRQHLNIHSGEKPFKCTAQGCSKAYKHASQLSNHKIIHQEFKTMSTIFFDDLSVFLKLVIRSFEKESRVFRVPAGPIKLKDIELPPITAREGEVKLPKFPEILRNNSTLQ